MNERLRASMAAAHVDVEGVARETGVDPKTVQRWLSGRVPHGRHRWAVAELVGEDEHYLWPRGTGAIAELHRTRSWWRPTRTVPMSSLASGGISWRTRESTSTCWATRCSFLVEQHPQLPALLEHKAADACAVRIALVDPDSDEAVDRDREEGLEGELRARIRTARRYFGVLDGCPGIRLHYHQTPLYNSLFRGDGRMFVTPHLYGTPGYGAPLLHLRRKGGDGIFDRFATQFRGGVDDLNGGATSRALRLTRQLRFRQTAMHGTHGVRGRPQRPDRQLRRGGGVSGSDRRRRGGPPAAPQRQQPLVGARRRDGLGESIAATVVREVHEETGLEVEVVSLVGIYSDPRHVVAYDDGEVRQQFSICFACRVTGGSLATSDESLDVRFFAWDDLGRLDIAAPIALRLRHFRRAADCAGYRLICEGSRAASRTSVRCTAHSKFGMEVCTALVTR